MLERLEYGLVRAKRERAKDLRRKRVGMKRQSGGEGNEKKAARLTRPAGREKALREMEQLYRSLAEQSLVGVYMFQDDEILYMNEALAGMLGASPDEMVGMDLERFIRLVHPEDRKHVIEQVRKKLRGDADAVPRYCVRTVPRSGRTRWMELFSGPIVYRGKPAVQGVAIDITEREEARRALEESERRYRLLAENATDVIWTMDLSMRFTYLSPSIRGLTGHEPEELTSHGLEDILTPEGLALATKIFTEELAADSQRDPSRVSAVELELKRKDGSMVWAEGRIRFIRDEENRPIGVLGVTRDVAARRHAEEALRESEEKYRMLFEMSPEAIALVDLDGTLLDCNHAAEMIAGLPRRKLVGRSVADLGLLSEEDAKRALDTVGLLASGGTTKPLEFNVQSADKRSLIVEVYPALIDAGRGRRVVQVMARDVTEERKMEEEMLRAQKVESLGILAGGIAHDFNNLLSAIIANVSLASRHAEPGGKVAERLMEARKELLRAGELTRRLLTFSKGGAPLRKRASIAELISDCMRIAPARGSVRCELSLPERLWPVEVDEGQICQVLNNLIINACQAMPEGGTVRLAAENISLSGEESLPLAPGDYVKVSVSDEGPGIRQEDLPKMFVPFFTTKKGGSGLGLATAYSVVKNHGGHISVESQPGKGATFHVYLPSARDGAAAGKPEEAPAAARRLRVLVVDDDDGVRAAATAALRDIGHEAAQASNGSQAVASYKRARSQGPPFDLVILDLTMGPGMDGKETMAKLLEIDPGAKVIGSSGYSDDPVLAEFERYGFSGILAKPYDLDEMARLVGEFARQRSRPAAAGGERAERRHR